MGSAHANSQGLKGLAQWAVLCNSSGPGLSWVGAPERRRPWLKALRSPLTLSETSTMKPVTHTQTRSRTKAVVPLPPRPFQTWAFSSGLGVCWNKTHWGDTFLCHPSRPPQHQLGAVAAPGAGNAAIWGFTCEGTPADYDWRPREGSATSPPHRHVHRNRMASK